MVWQLLIWATGAGAAAELAVACRPAAAAARRQGSVPGTVPAAAGALAVLVVIGLVLAAVTGLPTWAAVCWLLGTAAAAGWIALRRRDPAAWGVGAPATARPAPDSPASRSTPSVHTVTQPQVAAVEAPGRMSRDLADQDDLVQSLTIASYALQMGDAGRARQAVEAALSSSRATLDVLLREDAGRGFVRATPAAQSTAGSTAA
jgi:hypothetical protein